MNVSLTPELEAFVAQTVATGQYSSASEVIRVCVREFQERESWKRYAQSKIAKGLEDIVAGRVVTREELLARLKENRKRLQQKRA